MYEGKLKSRDGCGCNTLQHTATHHMFEGQLCPTKLPLRTGLFYIQACLFRHMCPLTSLHRHTVSHNLPNSTHRNTLCPTKLLLRTGLFYIFACLSRHMCPLASLHRHTVTHNSTHRETQSAPQSRSYVHVSFTCTQVSFTRTQVCFILHVRKSLAT